ncbi:MAG: MrcB family domain-containing protein [Acidobacteriota bacterium]
MPTLSGGNSLHDLFYKVMSEYGAIYDEVTSKQEFSNPFGALIRRDIPAKIAAFPELDSNIYIVKGRHGAGRWSSTPWIAVYDKRITTSAQKGAYIVYLVNKDAKELYLSLGLSATEAAMGDTESSRFGFISIARSTNTHANEKLKARSAQIRSDIGASRFLSDGDIHTGSEIYDAACIYYTKYTLDSLPGDEELKHDLLDFVDLYKKYYDVYVGDGNVATHVDDHWPSGARDTTEFPSVALQFDVSLREHLKAFCAMDGVGWTDYEGQNEASGLGTSGSRLRTYRKMYEKFGLIYREEDKIHLSRLGRQIAALETDLDAQKEAILNKLRITAIDILSRYQLRNPAEDYGLLESCDVLPSIVIWKAMMMLDKKLHYEEMNRVILRVMRMAELDEAIETIKTARDQYGNYSGTSASVLDDALGAPVHTEQAPARIAPWFSFVGWGGLIIEQNVDSNGFRNLRNESIPLIEKILENPPTYYEAKDEEDWLNYYIGSAIEVAEDKKDEPTTSEKVESAKKIFTPHDPRGAQPWPLNQILFGAPGTGKTYSSAEYAVAIVEKRLASDAQTSEEERKALMATYRGLVDSGFITFTTFHQNYGYEDFIQGIRPNTNNGTVSFEQVDGVFKKAADKALDDPHNNYVIIIDEINRANISKVFGELITLIEEDKRWGELNQLSATLPMGEAFVVPNNLYIIGTMNSADKSISLIDTALRRRFSFIEVPPKEEFVGNESLKQVMHNLNEYLKKELRNTDLLIGHAYFINKAADDLIGIMNNSIIPLLYEYFYDDEAKVKRALDCLKDTEYELDPKPLGRVRVQKKVTHD